MDCIIAFSQTFYLKVHVCDKITYLKHIKIEGYKELDYSNRAIACVLN